MSSDLSTMIEGIIKHTPMQLAIDMHDLSKSILVERTVRKFAENETLDSDAIVDLNNLLVSEYIETTTKLHDELELIAYHELTRMLNERKAEEPTDRRR